MSIDRTIVDLSFKGKLNEKIVPALVKHLKKMGKISISDAANAYRQLKKGEDAVLLLSVSFPGKKTTAMRLYLNCGENPEKFVAGIKSSIGHPAGDDFKVMQNLFGVIRKRF